MINYIVVDGYKVTFILLTDGSNWAVQGLNHDIAAQGDTEESAIENFRQTCIAEMYLGREHFLSIPLAPEYYHGLAKTDKQAGWCES